MASRVLRYLALALVAASCAVWWAAWRASGRVQQAQRPVVEPAPAMPFEEWARKEFLRRHPGEKPLNWAIARTAEVFYRKRPMGRFVLHRNDCSDFTDAILDEALGAKARFRRHSQLHIFSSELSLWEFYRWEPGMMLMPGDEIAVRHSPHYPPSDKAPWHRGIVGTDGMVYDWTKLKTWKRDRYGRHTVEWFLHNSRGHNEAIIRRLRPAYRYLIEPIPRPFVVAGSSRADGEARGKPG